MKTIQFWLFGFRSGWWEMKDLPYGAATAHDPLNRAYYSGYRYGAGLHRSLKPGG